MWHGRGHVHYVEMGLKRDGKITGLRVRTLADAGAYPAVGAFLPFFTQMMAQNVYIVPKVEFNWSAAITNTTPVAAYRGAGRPEAIHLVERTIDMAAVSSASIRSRSGASTSSRPRRSRSRPSPASVRSTTAVSTRRRSTSRSRRPVTTELRAEQADPPERGDTKMLGIGVASYLEISAPLTFNREYGTVEIDDATAR